MPIRRIFGWRPKVDATIVDVLAGRLSYSSHLPIMVSRLDSPRGGFFIVDGHHRVVEAVRRGDLIVRAVVDSHVPRIERTGGAYFAWVVEKVRVADHVV